MILVGSGGAVPDYHDYKRHVRLGDVVVGCPRHANKPGPSYVHCETFHQNDAGKFDYETRIYESKDQTLQVKLESELGQVIC